MSKSDSIFFNLKTPKEFQYEVQLESLKDQININATLLNSLPKKIYYASIPFSDFNSIKYLGNCKTIEAITDTIIPIIENGNSSLIENKENNLILKFSPTKIEKTDFSFTLTEKEISEKEKMDALYLTLNDLTNKVFQLEKENQLLKKKIENHQNLYNQNLQDIISMIKTLKDQKDSDIINLQYEIQSLKKNPIRQNPYSTNTLSYKQNSFQNTYKTQTINNNINNNNINNNINNSNNPINLTVNDPYQTYTAIQDIDTIPIQVIEAHLSSINHISVFPNGKFISVSDDRSIKLFDPDCILLSTLENAHENSIQYISIKNNNEFVTCSDDRSLKIWYLQNNIINLFKNIKNAHSQSISCVIYTSLLNICSCSIDKYIKIRSGNNYERVTSLIDTDSVAVFSLLEIDDDILVSGGWDGIKFWNMKNRIKISSINNCSCVNCNALARIDSDKIAVGGDKYGIIKIISISRKVIIRQINNFSQCYALMGIFFKGLFASGGEDSVIRLFSVETYECVKEINRCHEGSINGFAKIKNGTLVSFGQDGNIKIWNI